MQIKNLYFHYDKDEPVLKNINLEIKKQTIALVGKSGSGKTTLVDIISGIFQPIEGNILIDKINLNQIDISSFRKKLDMFHKKYIYLMIASKNNLVWVCEDREKVSDQDIIDVLKLSNAYGFVNKLKNGIDTFIGEKE